MPDFRQINDKTLAAYLLAEANEGARQSSYGLETAYLKLYLLLRCTTAFENIARTLSGLSARWRD